MRSRLIPLLPLLLLFFLFPPGTTALASNEGQFKISSPVFESNGYVPRRYTCDGKNVNPPFEIENVPQGAKSLALILVDADVPGGSFVHWILWNIDPGIKEIKESSVPKGAVQGINDFKKRNYGGPCPPSGTHRYFFKIYALSIRLSLGPDSRKGDLEKALKGHVIAQAQMMGLCKRK